MRRKSRENGLFADIPAEQWNDWHWQVRNRVETLDELKKYINLTKDEEEGVAATLGKLRMAITPYYLSLIDQNDPYDPIRKQAIPTDAELEFAAYEEADPLHEDTDSSCPGLTHRYPDRVLFLTTDMCSMYCRHCTRRRFAGQNDCDVPEIPCDPKRLRQVFLNILDNAAKHGGEGKTIDAAIRCTNIAVIISIRDYGPGIPEDEIPLVKKKFYKGSSKARGTGIGLAVCDEIVTMHDGTLDLSNAEGGGTCVRICLPLA